MTRVVVVHDYATQRGGAERVALAILDAFPGSRLVTAAYAPDQTFPAFAEHPVETLWTNRVPAFREDPRKALPFLASAVSRHRVQDADVVVCSSSGWAHGIGGDLPRIVYCHNPARWLYQVDDYLAGVPIAARRAFSAAAAPLRRWDRRAAARASTFFANSTSVRDRVAAAYGIDAEVLPPPTAIDARGSIEPVAGVEPGFLLTVSRARGYKNNQLICEAAESMPGVRLVVVGGLPDRPEGWSSRLVGLRDVSDAQLRWLYGRCVGLVAVSREDFGLTPIEAYSFGKPAAVLRAGGYLDSGSAAATAWIEGATTEAVAAGIGDLLGRTWSPDAIRLHAEAFTVSAFQRRLVAAVDELAQVRRRA